MIFFAGMTVTSVESVSKIQCQEKGDAILKPMLPLAFLRKLRKQS